MRTGRSIPSPAVVTVAAACLVLLCLLAVAQSRRMETRRFVRGLGPGLNLGNTLDVHDLHFATRDPAHFETYWGNPLTTRAMLEDIRQAGFTLLRVPVTWEDHLDPQGTVHPRWMARVRQVVDDALDVGLTVILNAHHDRWYTPDPARLPQAEEQMARLWGQIAREFAGYDHRLLFESMNEPRLIGTPEEWGTGTAEAQETVNRLNRVFVETVRAGEGYNPRRYLLLPTYCARAEAAALAAFQLPRGDRLIASVHLYTPYGFTLDREGAAGFAPQDPEDTGELEAVFRDLNCHLIRRGIPVILTEFGAVDKGNEGDRAAWAAAVRRQAGRLGIAAVWWDAGPGEEEGQPKPLYNRHARRWVFPELADALTRQPAGG